MTFEQWWMEYQGSIKWVEEGSPQAKAAWDYQQTIIDKLQYLNNLQQDRIEELQAKVEWLQSVINNGMLPEGYVLVPKEPTEKMLKAAHEIDMEAKYDE